jgi:uncharacterized repeat protein (TIGR03833 family)
VEEPDLLLLGSLVERASEWLERAGDLRAATDERVASEGRKPARGVERASAMPGIVPTEAGASSGTVRANVRPGQRVAIVIKADQASGKLTEGVVRELLTNSATHPRGIKVRLESGEVGRVKVICG